MYPILKTRNIKISLIINKSIIFSDKILILNPYKSIKITIYKHTPNLINITGIKSFKKLVKIKYFVEFYFKCQIIKQKTDAIMLNYKSQKNMKINLNKLYDICKDTIPTTSYSLDFNSELFNAPFLISKKGRGTMLLFSTGSVQVMGCKKKSYIIDNQKLIKLIYTLYKTKYWDKKEEE